MGVPHDMDEVTDWCRKCGASLKDIVDQQFLCTAAPNVTGVSHIIARRFFEQKLRPALESSGLS